MGLPKTVNLKARWASRTAYYPPKEAADVRVLTQRMEALERRLAERMVVDFVRPEKAKAEAPVAPELKLAAEIVSREGIELEAEPASGYTGVLGRLPQVEEIEEFEDYLRTLKPETTIAVSRMIRFTQKVNAAETYRTKRVL